MRWRILSNSIGPLHHWYEHPWEAELVMLSHSIQGMVQGFKEGENRTHAKYWYTVGGYEMWALR